MAIRSRPAGDPRCSGAADYQCPQCETRYVAEQWCPDCSRPYQRLGAGGICPCEEMITIEELTEDTGASSSLPVASKPIHH